MFLQQDNNFLESVKDCCVSLAQLKCQEEVKVTREMCHVSIVYANIPLVTKYESAVDDT